MNPHFITAAIRVYSRPFAVETPFLFLRTSFVVEPKNVAAQLPDARLWPDMQNMALRFDDTHPPVYTDHPSLRAFPAMCSSENLPLWLFLTSKLIVFAESLLWLWVC